MPPTGIKMIKIQANLYATINSG